MFLQKHILLSQKTVRPGYFIKVTRADNLSTLKEIRYEYKMFGKLSEQINDGISQALVDINEISKNDIENVSHKNITKNDQKPNLPPTMKWITVLQTNQGMIPNLSRM